MKLAVATAVVGAAGLAGTAGAVTPPPPAVGTISCLVKGSLKFKPPLLGYTGHPVNATTITLATVESGCSITGTATNIVKGTSKGSHISDSNDCATVLQAPLQPASGPLKWSVLTGTQKWAPSTISFTSATQGGDGVNTPYTLDLGGSSTGGSFNGDTATSHAQIKQTLAQIVKACTNPDPLRGGLKSLTIVSPQSTFALTSP